MTYEVGDHPIPGYKLDSFLGQGSYGSVWKAIGPGGVPCAMKFISLDNKSGLKEMKAIGLVKRLQHPNLCPVQAIWLKDKEGNLMSDSPGGSESTRFMLGGNKQLIIAMGLGQKTLAQRLEECRGRGGIPIRDLIRYMEDAAKGIDYLNDPVHDLGHGPSSVIHCDIKPANLLIVGGGVQVCDYGVARALSVSGADIRKTFAAGTPAYAPAELINNEPCAQTDQYSLAITYFELRTGHLPFDEARAIIANLTGQLDLSDLPPDEREVIRQATALQTHQRFESCEEMVEALKMAAGVTVTSRRGGPNSGNYPHPDNPASSHRMPQPGSNPPSSNQQPGSNPRYTPPQPVNPRGTDRVRFTPEPPEGYGGNEAVWPPSGPLQPPPSQSYPAPPGSDQSSQYSDPKATQRPQTPPYGGGPSYPPPPPPIQLVPEPGSSPNGGTIRFDGQLPEHNIPSSGKSGFADDPSAFLNRADIPPQYQQPKPRPKADLASDQLRQSWEAAENNTRKPDKKGGGLFALIASLLVLLVGGAGAAYYFLVYKPGNDFVIAPTGETTGSTPTTSSPPTDHSNTLKKLTNEVAQLFEKEDLEPIPEKLAALRQLPVSGALNQAESFQSRLEEYQDAKEFVNDLKRVLSGKDRDGKACEIDRDEAVELLDKVRAKSVELASKYESEVNNLPRSVDPIQDARSRFAKGEIKSGLDLIESKIKEKKLNSVQQATAEKLAKLWTDLQRQASTSSSTLAEVETFRLAIQDHAKSADKEDLPAIDMFRNLQVPSRIEALVPKLDGLTTKECQLLKEIGTKPDASALLQAAAIEAELEARSIDKSSNSTVSSRALDPEVDGKLKGYRHFLNGWRDLANAQKKPEEIIENWQNHFADPLPTWVTRHRATRMADVLKQALPEERNARKEKFTKWNGLITAISGRSGVPFAPPPDFDLKSYEQLFAKLGNPTEARPADYSDFYSKALKPFTTAEGARLAAMLPAEQQKPAGEFLHKVGQHLLVYSITWNSVKELQADETIAAKLADTLFEISQTTNQHPERAAWRGLAKLLQPNSDGRVEPAALAHPDTKNLLEALAQWKSTRYKPEDLRDLRDTIEKHRAVHEQFNKLLGNMPATVTALDKLTLKLGILQGLRLAEVDQSSYFRQEIVLNQVEKWTKTLGNSSDELFLQGRFAETYTNVLKPYTRFGLSAKTAGYFQAVSRYKTLRDQLGGSIPPELTLAESRTQALWLADEQSTKPEANKQISAGDSKAYEADLQQAIAVAKASKQAELLPQLHYWLARLQILKAMRHLAVSEIEMSFSASSEAIESCKAGLKETITLDGGEWHDELFKSLLVARKFEVDVAQSKDPFKLEDKISNYKSDAQSLKLSKRTGIQALGYVTARKMERKQANPGEEATLSAEEYRKAIGMILAETKFFTQDAEFLSELYREHGEYSFLYTNIAFGTTAELKKTIEQYTKAIEQFDNAYKLNEDYPFLSANAKAESAGMLGYWYKAFSRIHELTKRFPEFKDTHLAAYTKANNDSLAPLEASLSYTPLAGEYWNWQSHLADGYKVTYVEKIVAAEVNKQKILDETRLVQSERIIKTVSLTSDVRARRMDAENKTGYPIIENNNGKDMYSINEKELKLFKGYIEKDLSVLNNKQTKYQEALSQITLAELEMLPSQGGDPAKGKKLALEWKPKFETALNDPKLKATFPNEDQYLAELYLGKRILERIEKLIK